MLALGKRGDSSSISTEMKQEAEQSEPVIKASRRSGVCVGVGVHTCGVCGGGVCAHVWCVYVGVYGVCVYTHMHNRTRERK